ncbi:hypothetical protein ACEPAI_9984 [Sanghuangporus weigelae]
MHRTKTTRIKYAIRFKKLPKADWDHSLPVELLEVIFDEALREFTESGTPMTARRRSVQPLLRRLSRVCQTWYYVLTPMLYREIYLSSSNALAAFARAVTKYPDLQPLVHSFQFGSTMYKSARIDISQPDVWNIKRIYRACPNIDSLTVQRSLDIGGIRLGEERIYTTCADGFDPGRLARLTRLEAELLHGMPCNSYLVYSSDLILPALQELVLDVQKGAKSLPNRTQHNMSWPQMPQLTRLCIKNWYVAHGCFMFPAHSDKLRVIELLGGNYWNVYSFFDQDLRKFSKTLESLTITAIEVGSYHSYCVDLRYLTALTELCIPLVTYRRWNSVWYPPTLRRLILAGSPENNFKEENIHLLEEVEAKLSDLLQLRLRSCTLPNLKLVRLMVESVWLWGLSPFLKFKIALEAAKKGNVELIFGFLPGDENTVKGKVKKKLYKDFL